MKSIKIKTQTTTEVLIGDKSVNEVLRDIINIGTEAFRYSNSKREGCEILFEDGEYEDYANDMENRVDVLEEAILKILNLID